MGKTRAVRTPLHRSRRRALRRSLGSQIPRHHAAARRLRDGPSTTGTSTTATSGIRCLDGHLDREVEYAYHDWPWISVITFETIGGLPEAKVWSREVPPRFWRDHIRQDLCAYCAEPMSLDPDHRDPARGTVEHVMRKIDGGRGLENNTVGACARCNHGRGAADVLDVLLRRRLGLTREDL